MGRRVGLQHQVLPKLKDPVRVDSSAYASNNQPRGKHAFMLHYNSGNVLLYLLPIGKVARLQLLYLWFITALNIYQQSSCRKFILALAASWAVVVTMREYHLELPLNFHTWVRDRCPSAPSAKSCLKIGLTGRSHGPE